ncbi:fatty acid cis/trans isomerase [Viridibacterium curvum]|uniref:Fatty acid cis/trans isomerase n=1 Tax=Viridibacterium curvum TaxID=1101404 RepID=A0ABP9QKH2_9RHOO
MRRWWLVLMLLLAGCAAGLVREDLQALFGPSDPKRFDTPTPVTGDLLYHRDVQPILDQRCVVCHACNDAPCQLKLSSWDGVVRGASKEPVYNGARLLEAVPSRLYIDAQKPSEWRSKGFFPVLNEHRGAPAAELQVATLARMLDMKGRHPLVPDAPVPDSLDLSLGREQVCPAPEEVKSYEQKNPLWGMPFGLPAMSSAEEYTLRRWLAQGAPYEGAPVLPAETLQKVAKWENYFNGDSLREQLVSRYMYEHLFLAHLYFDDELAVSGPADKPRRFFRMVRSTTPPGQPVQEIATRRPFDDPGVKRPWYRLVPVIESISNKSHMPYALGEARMKRWNELFYGSGVYRVESLPPYTPETASNPFQTFHELPLKARYQFMLDEAQFTIMGFIKGPVCRGQTALNVINDHFWVFFFSPEHFGEDEVGFLKRESRNLGLPAAQGSDSLVITPWLKYAYNERLYLLGKSAYLDKVYAPPAPGPNLSQLWDGDGRNPNASLTVYRHFDSATVLKGTVGEKPKTAWVFGYPLLERVHYLLVAGYDVYGNVGHQVNTRLYMDFMRMEGEFNFLTFLPKASRAAARDDWYRGADNDIKDLVYGKYARFDAETAVPFKGGERPEQELMGMLARKLQAVSPTDQALSGVTDLNLRRELETLGRVQGSALSWMPESAFLRVERNGQPVESVSLLRNTGRANPTRLLREEKALLPAENSLDVLRGYVGAYPNAFFRVEAADLPVFRAAVAGLRSEADYQALVTRFGVRRTSNGFWAFADTVHADALRRDPIDGGLFDFNRLENR